VKISATIITYNEERNLPRAIESLRCADEILVVDSGSTDRTVEIAEKLGARVMESPWPGYAQQKNLAAENAGHDWILSLDADESLSEALEGEIWRLKKNGPEFDGYTMPRLAQYLGRWIHHSGWYPDRKVRLYNRQKARWQGEFVHESVKVDGRIGHLESNLLHFTCDSLSEHLKVMDRYTTLAAEQLLGVGEKPTWGRLIFEPPWTFFQTYVLKAGYLDGVEGLAIANMAALYNFVKYAKARFMSPGRE
jgi:glycosyltransferase involved in cell wall biosynthesis